MAAGQNPAKGGAAMVSRTIGCLSALALMIAVTLPRHAAGQEKSVAPSNSAPVTPPAPLSPSIDAPPESIAAPPPMVWPPEPVPRGDPTANPPPFDTGPLSQGMMGRDFRPSVLRGDYRVTWFPDEPVHGQNTDFGLVREDLSAVVPIWHDECNDFAATFHVRNEMIHTEAILPNTLQPFPQELWDVRLGTSYRHRFDNGWIAGASVSLGAAGDQPFESTRTLAGSVNAFLTIPQGERNYWLFNLAYSSSSDLRIPIPGVAFVWQPTDNFRAHLGLPFQLMYRPVDDLQFDVSYMLLYTFRARATYRLAPRLRLYAGYEVSNESYPLADAPDVQDRLFYYDQRLVSGLQFKLGQQSSLDLSGGYAFDRFYFEGQHLSDSNNNRVDIGNGAFISLQLQTRW
jgi:hypothetical protein